MTPRKTQKRIDQTTNLVGSLWIIVKDIAISVGKELKELGIIFWRNIKGPWSKTWKRKIATIIVISLTLLPMAIQYFDIGRAFKVWLVNNFTWEDQVAYLQTDHEKEIRAFFEEYNRRYSFDCDWVRTVNVDQEMYLQYGTKKKPGKGCITTEKWQIVPVKIESPQIDHTNQLVKVRGRAVITVSDSGTVKAIEENDFELWKKIEWENGNWKFNPFTNKKKW